MLLPTTNLKYSNYPFMMNKSARVLYTTLDRYIRLVAFISAKGKAKSKKAIRKTCPFLLTDSVKINECTLTYRGVQNKV